MINYKIEIYDLYGVYIDSLYDFAYSNFTKNLNNDFGQASASLVLDKDFNIDIGYSVKFYLIKGSAEKSLYFGKIVSLSKKNSNLRNNLVNIELQGALLEWSSCVFTQTNTNAVVDFSITTTPGSLYADLIKQANYKTRNSIELAPPKEFTVGFYTFNFSNNTLLEALQIVVRYLPTIFTTWFFKVNGDGLLQTIAIDTSVLNNTDNFWFFTPNHYFTFGREVFDFVYDIDLSKTINKIYAWNGQETGSLTAIISDATSISQYGEYSVYKTYQADNSTVLNSLATNDLIKLKNPPRPLEVTVLSDNYYKDGYDISTIDVGDVFTVLNNNTLNSVYVISSIDYQFDKIIIKADDYTDYTNRGLAVNQRETKKAIYKGDTSPTSY